MILIACAMLALAPAAAKHGKTKSHRHKAVKAPRPVHAAPEVAAPESEADEEEPPATIATDVPPSRPPETRRSASLEVALAFDAGPRDLSFSDDIFGRFAPYSAPFVPAVYLKAQYFPLARLSRGVPSWFGLDVHGSYAFTFQTRDTASGVAVSTQAYSVGGGLVARFPLGPLELAIMGLVEHRVFAFSGAPGDARPLSVRYVWLEPALRLRAFLPAGIRLGAEAGYLGVIEGGFRVDFPRAAGTGVRVAADLAWETATGVGFFLGAELRWVGFDFRVQPGDPWVLGGVMDRQITGRAGVSFAGL